MPKNDQMPRILIIQSDPALLPPDWETAARAGVPGTVARDYIAGMTDRFALEEYRRVFRTEIQL